MGRGVRADRQTKFKEVRDKDGGAAIGVIGSNRTTNEENYLLQKFARVVLETNNIDHHRTADFPAFAAALRGKAGRDGHHARGVRRSGDSADRQRSDGAASAAGVADSHQRAAASRASSMW